MLCSRLLVAVARCFARSVLDGIMPCICFSFFCCLDGADARSFLTWIDGRIVWLVGTDFGSAYSV